jgi:hypothetical protein
MADLSLPAARSWAATLPVQARRRARLTEAVLVLLLLAASTLALHRPLVEQKFSVDESYRISMSRYFWTTFIERDLSGPAWQPNYLILTQPPVTHYLLGFGLWLQGWTPDQLNSPYNSRRGRDFNNLAGNVPHPTLLAAARRVEFVLALGALLLLYLIGRTLLDRPTGVLALALALGNPLLSTHWTRALAEAPLAFWSLLALFLALRSVGRLATHPVSIRSCMATGAALGLAAATKLSGVLGCIGLAYFIGLQQALAVWRTDRLLKLRHWLVLGLLVACTFVAVNPLLYPNPIGNTALLFQFRALEMEEQRRTWPVDAVPDSLPVRLELIAKSVFRDYGTVGRVSLPLEVLLFAGGLGITLLIVARDLKAGRPFGPPALFLCWVLATYALSTVYLGFDSPHYYAPLLQLNVVLEAVALSWATSRLLDRARRRAPGRYLRSVGQPRHPTSPWRRAAAQPAATAQQPDPDASGF